MFTRTVFQCAAMYAALLVSGSSQAQAADPESFDSQKTTLVCAGIVNAPPEEVWRVFSTDEGFQKLGVAKAKVDLRPGGLILSHYDPNGELGDEGTIQTEILSYEPLRMLTTRIQKPPKGFPFPEAWKRVWTVISLSDLGDQRTEVRLAMIGYDASQESQEMREFFRTGNEWVLKKIQSHYGAPAPTTRGHQQDPLAPIELSALVSASRADVWKSIFTAEGWKRFMGTNADIGQCPLEPFEIYFGMDAPAGERGSEGCKLLAIVPEELLCFTWTAPPAFPHARKRHGTWVVINLDEVAPAITRVRLRHLGFEQLAAEQAPHAAEQPKVRAYFASAWPHVLRALKQSFTPEAAAP